MSNFNFHITMVGLLFFPIYTKFNFNETYFPIEVKLYQLLY